MKTISILLTLVWLGVSSLPAQVAQPAPVATAEPIPADKSAPLDKAEAITEYKVAERDAHSRVWARVSYQTNKLGEVTTSTNSYTELATGMHYRDGDQWLPSEAKIEILPNNAGAAASKGQHKAIFPPEIKSGIIELQTPDNQWMRSRVWGLAYFDGTTGESVLIAEVKESSGQVVGDNEVIYPDAFTDVQADIRYTYTLAGFEQDVVIRQQLAGPEKFGLNPKTTRLQVLTEFVESPIPTKESRQAGALADQALGFGQMSIGSGKAFSVDAVGDTTGEVAVAKEWTPLEGRDFLIEEVHYEKVAEQLQKLPASTEYKGASLQRRGSGTNVIAGLKKIIPKRYAKASPKPGTKRMAQAKPTTAPGFVMDYVTLNNDPNRTFKGDTTYHVANQVSLSGTTTIEGGTVVKFSNTTAAKILFSGAVICNTEAYRTAVFTSMNDDSVGEMITGSIHVPGTAVNTLLVNNGSVANSYKYLRFKFAATGLSDPYLVGVWHSQFLKCGLGIFKDSGSSSPQDDILLRNVLFVQCTTCVKNYADVNAQHITADGCSRFAAVQVNGGTAINSIITGNPNTTIGPVSFLAPNYYQSGSSGVYKTAGAGSYYLADSSSLRNQGTTPIDQTLANDLQKKTTVAPTILSGNITANTSKNTCATLDTDTPDLGYHYEPLDYVSASLTISSGTLTLGTGVALGTSPGANANSGIIWITGSGKLVSEGTPTKHNRIVRYNAVQEGSPTTLVNKGILVQVDSNSTTPEIRCRFTDWSGSSGVSYTGSSSELTIYNVHQPFSFKDCQFFGTVFFLKGTHVDMINCLWERGWLDLKDDGDTVNRYIYNNLLRNSTLTLVRGGAGATVVKDNVFDSTTISPTGTIDAGNNGFTTGTANPLGGNNNKPGLSPADFESSPSGGSYYYKSPPPSSTLEQLIDTGSRTPGLAGLFHHTVRANQTKEGTTPTQPVDIGFHYVALENGNPKDTDGDGTPDYLEDPNGNGLTDGSETPWELPPSSLVITPASQTVAIGGAATFTVTAAGSTPFTYQWSFNGSPLANGTLPDGTVVSGAQTATLTLTPVALGRTGNYSVTVANSAGNPTATCSLCVPQPINLAADPLTHVRGSGPSLIDTTASYAGNWSGAGVLTVQFFPGTSAGSDKLAIRNQTVAPGSISLNGSTIRYGLAGGGTVDIGTFSGGLNGAPLQITLLAAATDASLDALLQNLTYELDATQICKPQTQRVLQLSIDSGTACSGIATKTIIISCPVVEVVLIIDKSGSMDQGGKLGQAKAAATYFAQLLNLQTGNPIIASPDRAALVTFCAASAVFPLNTMTTSEDAIKSAIGDIVTTCYGTDIKAAVEAAKAHLVSYHVNGNKRVIVLLTDGEHTGAGDPNDAATIAKAAGIHLVTIGLQVGGSAGSKLLDMASFKNDLDGPKDYYSVDVGQSLNLTYEQIAHSLCVPINRAPVFLGAEYVGAHENADFNITYAMLQPSATDDGCSPIKFRFKGGLTGTLKYPGGATVPVGAMLATGETWVWRAPLNVDTGTDPNNKMVAFNVDAYDGELASSQGDVRISVLPLLDNNAPSVSAGKDRTVIKPSGANGIARLEGYVSDDGLPSGSLTVAWSVLETPAGVSPSSVIFTPSDSPTAQVSFPAAGRYFLKLTANDGSGAVSDTTTVFVCDQDRRPKEVILIAEHSRYLMKGQPNYALRRASEFVDFLPLDLDQVGLVSFDAKDLVFLQHTLTHDGTNIRNPSLWAGTVYSDTIAIGDAIRVALLELNGPKHNPDAEKVIIYFGNFGYDGPLYPYIETGPGLVTDAIAVANEAKASGIRIIAVGLFDTQFDPDEAEVEGLLRDRIASNPSDYYAVRDVLGGVPSQVYKSIVEKFCSTKQIKVEAGLDQTIARVGSTATFQLSGSVPTGSLPVTYSWAFVDEWSTPDSIAPSHVNMVNANTAQPTINLNNVPDPTGTYVFRVTATDTAGASGVDHVIVRVTSQPVDDVFVVEKGSENNVLDPLKNDPNNTAWLIESVDGALASGTTAIGSSGGSLGISFDETKLIYSPAPDFDGDTETFTYYLMDQATRIPVPEAGATIKIFVRPVNEPPVARDFTAVIAPDSGEQLFHIAPNNVTDPNLGDNIYLPRIMAVTQPENGVGEVTVYDVPYDLKFTPPSTPGIANFTYTVMDTYGLTATGKVTVNITYDPQLLGWKAIDDVAIIEAAETSKIIDVLAEDVNGPNVIESITAVLPAGAGTAVILGTEDTENTYSRPVIKFTPGNRSSSASFSYRIVPGTNPDHQAVVRVGFRAGTASDAVADITNLDPTGSEQIKIVRDGILEVHGTASDALNPASFVKYYLVLYDPQNNELKRREYQGRVAAGVLGELDLTGFSNGVYRVALEVHSIPDGNFEDDNVYIMLDSPFKLGRFNLGYTDLTVPVEGVPVSLNRSYDSFDSSMGDFGAAWHMSIGAGYLKKNGVLGANWRKFTKPSGETCIRNYGQTITVNLGGGKELNFIARALITPVESCVSAVPSVMHGIVFDPLPGTVGTLAIMNPLAPGTLSPEETVLPTGDPGFDIYEDITRTAKYDPNDFVYTDPSGREYTFKVDPATSIGRVTSIKNPHGSKVVLVFDGNTPNSDYGIDYYPATTLTPTRLMRIVREDGRITKVFGPSEIGTSQNPGTIPTLTYHYRQYAGEGYLSNVRRLTDKTTDPANPVYVSTGYAYDYQTSGTHPEYAHYITKITGPSGAVRNEYDDEGRLIMVVDPLGAKTKFDYSQQSGPFESTYAKGRQVVTDPLGNITKQEYDTRGNIVCTIDALGKKTLREFDSKNHKTNEVRDLGAGQSLRTDLSYTYSSTSPDMIQTYKVTPPHVLVPADPNRNEDADFQTVTLSDAFGRMTEARDANYDPTKNNSTKIVYVDATATPPTDYIAALGKVKSMTDAKGKTTTFTYPDVNADGFPDRVELDTLKNKTITYMNGFGYTVKEEVYPNTAPVGNTPIYAGTPAASVENTYTVNGDMEFEITTRSIPGTTDKEKIVRKIEYDDASRVKTNYTTRQVIPQSGPAGPVLGLPDTTPGTIYDEAGRIRFSIQSRTLPDGSKETLRTTYDYNARGELLRTTYSDGSFTESAYDLAGRRISTTDKTGLTTRYVYDAVGRNIETIYPDGTKTSTVYDNIGRVKTSKDKQGVVTTYEYDESGRNKSVTTGTTTFQYFYDKLGNRESVKDPLSRETKYKYDELSRLIRVTYPDLTYQVTTYNDLGLREEEIDQAGVSTKFEYDALGHLSKVTKPFKTYTMGNPDPVVLDANPADQTVTQFRYDELGNMLEQEDAAGRITKFEYDAQGRRTKRTLPGLQYEQLTYTDLGQVKTRRDFNAKTTTFEYDGMGRPVKSIPDPTLNLDPVVFSYFSDGRRASMKYPLGPSAGSEEVTYHYKGDRLWKKVAPQGTITYDYTDNGRLASIATSHGMNVTYQWDALSRLEYVDDTTDGVVPTHYTYDVPGNLEHVIYPNGVNTTYTYNTLNRLTQMSVANASTLATFNYNPTAETDRTLGPTGIRRALRETINLPASVTLPASVINRNVNYDYDKLYRLTKEDIILGGGNTLAGLAAGAIIYDAQAGYADLPTLGYDKVGNRHSRSLQGVAGPNFTALQVKLSQFTGRNYDKNDRIDPDANPDNVNPNFDDNGNTKIGEVTPAQTAADAYDFANRLITRNTTLDVDGNGTTEAATVKIVYDGDGNRVRKTITGGGTTKKIDYLVDDRNPTGYAQVLEEMVTINSGASTLNRSYLYGHDLISQKQSSGTRHYFGYDGHGSVRFLTSTAGVITDAYNYEAFGILLDEWHAATTATPNNYLYAGEQYDSDLGLYYLRARYMNPKTGSFWSMDSYEGSQTDPLSLHKYLYANNDVVNGIDPSGREFTYIGLGSAMTVMSTAFSMYLPSTVSALQAAQRITGSTDFGDLIYGLEVVNTINDYVQLVQIAHGLTMATVNIVEFLSKNAYKLENLVKGSVKSTDEIPSILKSWDDLRTFRNDPNNYFSHKELQKKIHDAGLSGHSQGLESHHLLEKQFADRFGINPDDIIAAPLVPSQHRNVGGMGVNIDSVIVNRLKELGTNAENASREQIWQAHRFAYDLMGKPEFAEAIYKAYVGPLGIPFY